jgi:hypothetical protein
MAFSCEERLQANILVYPIELGRFLMRSPHRASRLARLARDGGLH